MPTPTPLTITVQDTAGVSGARPVTVVNSTWCSAQSRACVPVTSSTRASRTPLSLTSWATPALSVWTLSSLAASGLRETMAFSTSRPTGAWMRMRKFAPGPGTWTNSSAPIRLSAW